MDHNYGVGRQSLLTWPLVACALAVMCSVPTYSQIQGMFRITSGSFENHMEFRKVDLAPGKDLVRRISLVPARSPISTIPTTATLIDRRNWFYVFWLGSRGFLG
jgi:hypothetical protein